MKKLSAFLIAITMFVLAGCTSANTSSTASSQPVQASSKTEESASQANKPEGMFKIGILQLEAHPALDAAYEGFVAGLAQEGFIEGENIEIDYKNAQGEISNCPTIASKLVNDKNDLILAIATPAAQAVASATKDIPVLITAVTNPQDAKLVESNEAPGTNVTGTSDLSPVKEQMQLLKRLVPEAKTVGILYCSSEANSIFQAGLAKEALDELGIAYNEFTVSNTNELQSVVTSMVGKVDAVYAPTDNLVAKAMPTVAEILNNSKVPIIVGEENLIDAGGLASVSISYLEIGKITGTQAAKILRGEEKPETMPIQYQENTSVIINEEVAKQIGVEIPEDLKA